MKTIKQVISENGEYKTLINAVISRIGKDSIQDVNNHGAQSGFPGFIWYTDTYKFAMQYRKNIVRLLEETAEQFGEEIITMFANFGIFRNSPMDNDDKKDLYKYLGGGKPVQSTITNTLAWFALEEICRMFDE